MKVLFLIFTALLSCSVFAWDGTASGKISNIDVAPGNNYGFRVTLEGAPSLCGNTHTWAYLNDTDSNYQTFVSVLLAAKAAKMTVTLYSIRKTDGYCHLGYMSVN